MRVRKNKLNGGALRHVHEEWDLGVQIPSSLEVATQVHRTVNKAYGTQAFIDQGIE